MWRKVMFILALGTSAAPASATGCFDYGPIQLSGTLVRQTYAGPPDYESVTKGDAPVTIWVLSLDRTLCVIDSRGRYPKEYGTREVQVELPADQYSRYQSLLGAKIAVAGELIRGGARHDKRLVLVATELTR